MTKPLKRKKFDTTRQVFDFVKAFLLKQNAQSMLPDKSNCAYFGVGGKRCGVGALLLDSAECEEIEGLGIVTLFRGETSEKNCEAVNLLKDALRAVVTPRLYKQKAFRHLLIKIQTLHDGQETEHWINDFDHLEKRFFGNKEVLK